mmetsp:Transcript_43526/g.102563  ORF Transcript_43526/g.102563 Transcript_43526/m.102563 type:complete len:636 (-) Transcript_43526:292-2199(-)
MAPMHLRFMHQDVGYHSPVPGPPPSMAPPMMGPPPHRSMRPTPKAGSPSSVRRSYEGEDHEYDAYRDQSRKNPLLTQTSKQPPPSRAMPASAKSRGPSHAHGGAMAMPSGRYAPPAPSLPKATIIEDLTSEADDSEIPPLDKMHMQDEDISGADGFLPPEDLLSFDEAEDAPTEDQRSIEMPPPPPPAGYGVPLYSYAGGCSHPSQGAAGPPQRCHASQDAHQNENASQARMAELAFQVQDWAAKAQAAEAKLKHYEDERRAILDKLQQFEVDKMQFQETCRTHLRNELAQRCQVMQRQEEERRTAMEIEMQRVRQELSQEHQHRVAAQSLSQEQCVKMQEMDAKLAQANNRAQLLEQEVHRFKINHHESVALTTALEQEKKRAEMATQRANNLEEALSKAQRRADAAEAHVETMGKDKIDSDRKAQDADRRSAEADKRVAEAERKASEAAQQVKDLTKANSEAQQKIEEVTLTIAARDSKVKALEKLIDQMRASSDVQQLTSQLRTATARCKVLEKEAAGEREQTSALELALKSSLHATTAASERMRALESSLPGAPNLEAVLGKWKEKDPPKEEKEATPTVADAGASDAAPPPASAEPAAPAASAEAAATAAADESHEAEGADRAKRRKTDES